MVKHNNVLANVHLRKDWKNHVRTWFNQPARKQRRLLNRQKRAADQFPRPAKALRPIVRGQTRKYSNKTRYGRGFSLEELKQAGLNPQFARSVGIAVDHRRQSASLESLQLNAQRLKSFKEKVILFPRKEGKAMKGMIPDSVAEKLKSAEAKSQNLSRRLVAKAGTKLREKATKITDSLKNEKTYRKLRLERVNRRYRGRREKRAKEAEEKKE